MKIYKTHKIFQRNYTTFKLEIYSLGKKESNKKKNSFAKKIEQLKDFKDKIMVNRKVKPINLSVKGENDHLNYSLCLDKLQKDTDPSDKGAVVPKHHPKNLSFTGTFEI
jgi:hypothetical protein